MERAHASKFNYRAFSALMVAFSAFSLPLTGYFNHVYCFAQMGMARHAWMALHNIMGLTFVVFSLWHIWLNRRLLWKHLRGTRTKVLRISREALLACAIICGLTALAVVHALH